MSINPISRPATGLIQKAPSLTSSQTSAAAAQQEASETLATTRQEAAKGDPAAIRKLAKLKQQQELLNPSPSPKSSQGGRLNRTA